MASVLSFVSQDAWEFYLLAVVVGLVQGGSELYSGSIFELLFSVVVWAIRLPPGIIFALLERLDNIKFSPFDTLF